MICTIVDCEAESNLYLCGHCIQDLQAWIDKGRVLWSELAITVARLDNVRVGNAEGGNGSKSAGSAAPLNLDALQLRINLGTLTQDAEYYAHDQFAAGIAWTVQGWVTSAELVISGPEEERIDHAANREKITEAAPPLPTRQLVKWLRKEARISVKPKDIRNWAARGKLRPVERDPLPTYWPHEVIELHQQRSF